MYPNLILLRCAAALMIALGTSACGGRTTVHANPTTCGKELADLQEAQRKGALSDKEYARLRAAVIKRCGK